MRASPRPTTIIDFLILVAAAAVGLAAAKANYDVLVAFPDPTSPSRGAVETLRRWAPYALVPLTVAWLAIRLRHPRPTWPRLGRQPGMAAGAAAGAVIGLGVGVSLVVLVRRGFVSVGQFTEWIDYTALMAGVAVLGAWITLALGRRWRPEAGWIDRSGRVLGACWIGLMLVMIASDSWTLHDPAGWLGKPPTAPLPVPQALFL